MREYLNGTPDTANIFGSIFDGCNKTRGRFKYRNKLNGRKESTHDKQPIDILSHLRGEVIQGRSPVRDGKCKWGAIDIDKKIPESDFCSKLWIYDRSLIPFKSLSGNWHVYKFYNNWTDVQEVKKDMKKIEKDLIGKGYPVDKSHTLPTGWSDNGSGSWMFLPYSQDNVCYSPIGNPLNISQFIYRFMHREHPLIAGAVGMDEKQNGRPKVMFNACLYMHYNKVNTTPEELNLNLSKPLSDRDVENAKGVEEYTEEYLNKNINNYLGELCNDEIPFEKTKEEEEKPKRKKGLTSYNFNEFTTKTYPPIYYYLYPIISNESVVLGWSLPGVGKTLFTFDMLFHVSQGKNFLHWNHNKPEDPPVVLYCEFEMSSKQLQDRALEIAERENFKIKSENFRVATLGDQPNGQYRMLTTPEGREDVEVTANEMFEKTGKKPIIVIDNIRFALGNFDEKEGKEWIPFVLWCAQMRSKGFSILYLHHAVNTGNKFSGSGYGNSNVNVEFQLRLPTDAEEDPEYDTDNYTQFVFQFKKMRENVLGAMTPFLIVTSKKTHKWFKVPLLSKTERGIKDLLDDGMSVKEIVTHGKAKELDGFSKANVHKVKKKLGVKDETDKDRSSKKTPY
tara:strand:+ start:827 stop:2683 length:1857 start_codon:yes stop_codon:yes gene_type:complete